MIAHYKNREEKMEGTIVEKENKCRIREHAIPYMATIGTKNEAIGGNNSYYWKDSYYSSKSWRGPTRNYLTKHAIVQRFLLSRC
jgi:hypothetical protein